LFTYAIRITIVCISQYAAASNDLDAISEQQAGYHKSIAELSELVEKNKKNTKKRILIFMG
jgi:hypothetical protein